MSTRLGTIRRELGSLRRRRQGVRVSTALCGLAIIILWVLALAFMLDVALKMAVAQRAAFLVLYAIITVWAVRKYVLPWLGHRETDIDMALLVEKHQKIDSELVAALQFESAEAESWGSPRLRTAVVEYVAEYGRNWNFMEGVPTRPLQTRAGLLAVTALVIAGAVFLWPNHISAFLQRFCLLNARYPSQTRVTAVRLKSEVEELTRRDEGFRAPFGKKLTFEFLTEGTLPDEGRLETASNDERRSPVVIKKTKQTEGGATIYEATLDRLLQPITFQAYLNDTWTEKDSVAVIPSPLVELKLQATVPEYARIKENEQPPTRERQISVLQGSAVGFDVTCANKSLQEARLLIKPLGSAADKAEDWTTINLVRTDEQGHAWKLDAAGSALARVDHELQYELKVKDEDGLTTDGQILGSIRVKPDRKPTVIGTPKYGSANILAQARKEFEINASDDYALAGLAIHLEIVRQAEGSGPVDPATADVPDHADLKLPLENGPLLVRDGKLPYKIETYVLPLEPYRLSKGDQLKVFFEATDYRGPDVPGETTRSDPIVLTVTDQSNIYAGIEERDALGVKLIDEINKTQLGTGGNK